MFYAGRWLYSKRNVECPLNTSGNNFGRTWYLRRFPENDFVTYIFILTYFSPFFSEFIYNCIMLG
jgi:hypothetical protein